MDLSTTYCGLKLAHPFMPGASPLVNDMDNVRRLEDAGASAIVMHSLFEEQIKTEQLATAAAINNPAESFAEALSYLPEPLEFRLGPDEYLEHIRRIKEAVKLPVFGSLNGTTIGGWLRYAKLIEQAGADALELNVYELVTDDATSSLSIEDRTVQMVEEVRRTIGIPLTVKLSPFYTALPSFARRLRESGVDGLVLFNRFYQPDIDVDQLEMYSVNLSSSSELLLRLRWLGILFDPQGISLAASGGVHTCLDAVKSIMCGASAVQMVSALLRRGPEYLATVRTETEHWLEKAEYESLSQLRGSMSLRRCPDPRAYERANYIKILQSWR